MFFTELFQKCNNISGQAHNRPVSDGCGMTTHSTVARISLPFLDIVSCDSDCMLSSGG